MVLLFLSALACSQEEEVEGVCCILGSCSKTSREKCTMLVENICGAWIEQKCTFIEDATSCNPNPCPYEGTENESISYVDDIQPSGAFIGKEGGKWSVTGEGVKAFIVLVAMAASALVISYGFNKSV